MQQERLAAGGDLQASTPEVRIGLSRAGVTGVQKAVRMQHGDGEALVSAEIECFVDLDPAQKGVHMSRFPEVFEEAIDEVVIEEKLLVETLPSTSRDRSSAGSTRCGRRSRSSRATRSSAQRP